MTIPSAGPSPSAPSSFVALPSIQNETTLLSNIAESLSLIATQMGTAPQLGFVQPPKPTWIYANRTQGDRWYWRTPEGEYVLCPTSALAGRLVQLEFKEVTRRKQLVWKLWATLEADRTYIIEAGRESVFTKSLLAAIASLTPFALRQPIILDVEPGDQNDESLFCGVYIGGEKIYKKWGDSPDWNHIAQTAMSIVNQANNAASALSAES